MYLLINLSEQQIIHLALFDEKEYVETRVAGKNRELLSALDLFLRDQGLRAQALRGIMVVTGRGSFTNTRISTVVANVFGYVGKIPLLTIPPADLDRLVELIPKLERAPRECYISATYSGEPHIGPTRQGT